MKPKTDEFWIGHGGILFDKSDVAKMSSTTKKLDALLKADGYSLLECGSRDNGGIVGTGFTASGIVNKLEYMRGEGERVYFFVHEKSKRAVAHEGAAQ
jgi:hypothetical protein